MENNNIRLFLLLLVGIQSFVFCQTDDIKKLQKVLDQYKQSEAYHIEVTYNMLRGLKGNQVTESYRGDVYKIGEINKFSIRGSEMIQSSEEKITLHHKQKLISYEKKDNNTIEGSPINLSMFLDYYKIAQVREENGELIYEMVVDKKTPQINFSRILLYINKQTLHLTKQELLFSRLMPFKEGSTSKLDYARLIIELVYRDQDARQKMAISDYINNTNGKLETTNKFQDYKFINKAQ